MAASRDRSGGDAGVTSIELVLYTPLLFFAIFVIVQFGLLYLGDHAASATARQTARVARIGGDSEQARQDAVAAGRDYAATVGQGVFTPTEIAVEAVDNGRAVRVTVKGRGMRIVPGVPVPDLEAVVQGPVEGFRADTP